ncbi:MAG TPA: peptidoglycan-binding domain-containing protein [Solirubrobacteraceae bacterium]
MGWLRQKTSAWTLWPAVAVAITACALLPTSGLAAQAPVPQPFKGGALWVTQLAPGQSGAEVVAQAASAGLHTVYLKAAEGSTSEPQFAAALVSEMRAAGATVCGWMFAVGANPQAEAAAAVAAAHAGAQCLVVDAEGEYDSLYYPAQLFVHALRTQLGASFPIGLASQAEVYEHPKFPYSVFLGPGAFNVVLPLMYWLDFGISVDAVYSDAMAANAIYGRPILPVGQLYGTPTSAELLRFRALAHSYGSPGVSFFDLAAAQPGQLPSLASPFPALPRTTIRLPTVHSGADGDEIVQSQELLNAAGAHLPVGGFFGTQTAKAVAAFQARHHLAVNGVLGAATWKALLHFRPREPSWAAGPPDSAQ